MAIIFDGVTIPEDTGEVIIDGTSVDELTMDGVVVWNKYRGPNSPVIITASDTLVAGIDFPSNTNIYVKVLGAGGGGGMNWGTEAGEGGRAALVVDGNVDLPHGTSVTATVGEGGQGGGGNYLIPESGSKGGSSTFYNMTSTGGAGGRKGTDGSFNCIGASSEWGTGGGCSTTTGGTGGIGSGGGGISGASFIGIRGGAGGRGEIRLSW